jgi:hypothetical protein
MLSSVARNLKLPIDDTLFQILGVPPTIRTEQLTVEQWTTLAKYFVDRNIVQ